MMFAIVLPHREFCYVPKTRASEQATEIPAHDSSSRRFFESGDSF